MNEKLDNLVKNNETVNLLLSVNEVNVVLAGLGELPAKVSYDLIEKVRNQVIPQVQKGQGVNIEK